jgi:predicted metalloprotease with PDZ domain
VGKDLTASLETFKAGDTVTVDFIRRDALQSTMLTLSEDFDKEKKVKALKDATPAQMALFKAWMGVDHPNQAK